MKRRYRRHLLLSILVALIVIAVPSTVFAAKLMIDGDGYKLSKFAVDVDTELKPYI